MKPDGKHLTVVAVSGGFDPVHIGHIRMFREARALGDRLVVIMNNDNWLLKKKGYVFMSQQERKEVIEAIRYVDEVVVTAHPVNPDDMSVCRELERLRPDIFANGGDRFEDNIPEAVACREIGCGLAFNVGAGGKVQSSSWLVGKLGREKEREHEQGSSPGVQAVGRLRDSEKESRAVDQETVHKKGRADQSAKP